jgi:hypothetical protein
MTGESRSIDRVRIRLDTDELISPARELRVQSQTLVAHAIKLSKTSEALTRLPARRSGR